MNYIRNITDKINIKYIINTMFEHKNLIISIFGSIVIIILMNIIFGQNIWKIYKMSLKKSTLFTNFIISTFFWGLGSFVSQKLKIYVKQQKEIDYNLIKNSALYGGIFSALIANTWYNFIDSQKLINLLNKFSIPTENKGALALMKMIIDEIIWSPISVSIFLITMSYLNNDNIIKEYKKDFLKTYAADLKFWPIVMLINFYFIPKTYRILFNNIMDFIWSIFINFISQ